MGAMKETLYYAMQGAARATWSTIKYIDGIDDLNKKLRNPHPLARSGLPSPASRMGYPLNWLPSRPTTC